MLVLGDCADMMVFGRMLPGVDAADPIRVAVAVVLRRHWHTIGIPPYL